MDPGCLASRPSFCQIPKRFGIWDFQVLGFRFRVQGLRFRVLCLGVQGFRVGFWGFRVKRIWGSGWAFLKALELEILHDINMGVSENRGP